MKIVIHRGSNEIGGTCIELATAGTKILLDLGLPLGGDGRKLDVHAMRPDAVIVSHPHQDHFGLIEALDPSVPVYLSVLSKKLIDAPRIFLHKELLRNDFRYFSREQVFSIGDFTITPYLVDHSAPDAYAFLIEAEGKRIVYSGDFRGHGRKAKLHRRMVAKPPTDIDVLFMEGTMFHRSNEAFPSEESVEETIFTTIRRQENISFLIASSQNIDRLVSAYRACRKARKILVIDIYTAWILEQLKTVSRSVPNMDWEGIGVYVGHGQYKTVQDNQEFFVDFQRRLFQNRVTREVLMSRPADYLYFGKMHMAPIIRRYFGENPVNVIYSQWPGYLKCSDEEYFGAEGIAALRNDPMTNFVFAHTSGHATVVDLRAFASAINPRALIPVHTEYGCEYGLHFDKVIYLRDTEVIRI
jgi:ribonuclease J